MSDDLELLSAWALRADQTAFRALVSRYAGLVHGVAARRTGGQRALAQEIGQNVFTMLARKAGSLRGHPCLASWLHRAAVLESAHLLRRESVHARKLARLATHLETMSPPPDPPDAPQSGPEIDTALAQLSETDRAVLLMRFFEDRSYREIAEISGQNEAAARKRVERALARLAPHLGQGAAAAVGILDPLEAAGPLRAALEHAAPEGFAASAGTAALAGAPALTAGQLLFHSLKLMTLGKSAFLTAAALLALLTFGGSYAASRQSSRSAATAAASADGSPAPDAASATSAARGQRPPLSPAGNPGDSPARAALRERLRFIAQSMSVDLQQRSIQFMGSGLPSGEAMRALGEFEMADLDEAWKLLPDFRAKPREFKSVAAFLTSLRLEKDPPQDILHDLLQPEWRIDGKPSDFATYQVLGGWFSKDPAAAWDWMRQAVPKGDFPSDRRFHYGSDFVGEWLAKDPAAALKAMASAGPEWTAFSKAALAEALKSGEAQEQLWPVLEKSDDRTALLLSDSHLQESGGHSESSDWVRDTVLPWLLTRSWADGTGPERVLHGWTWKDGELFEPGFGMMCASVGRLPDDDANAALLQAVRKVFDGITPDARPALFEKLVKDPERRKSLTAALAQGTD